MRVLLILGLFPTATHSMHDFMGRRAQNNERILQECLDALDKYPDDIVGYPAMQLIVEHPRFLELMEKTANQDALWANNQHRVLQLLVDSIENRGPCFLKRSLAIQVQLVDIFLAAAAHKGHHTFIDAQVPISNRTLLGQAVQSNNLDCAKKILEYGPRLNVLCYCDKTRRSYSPLAFASLRFGLTSPMTELLLSHGATITAQERDLLLTRLA